MGSKAAQRPREIGYFNFYLKNREMLKLGFKNGGRF